ncbi:beta strand repeat-containing protein [Acinetobacter kookii]
MTGQEYVGGLVGINVGSNSSIATIIENSYATSAVSKTAGSTGTYFGGLVGSNSFSGFTDGVVTNSYWNNTVNSGAGLNNIGTGLTTAQMFDKNNFTGFDFTSVWGNGGGQTTPYLLNMANNQVFNKNDLPTGTITPANRPALYTAILNVNQLQDMNKNLSGKYLLGNNIDASDTVNWNSGAGFNPIGNDSTAFTGIFDGLNHTINDLTINRSSTNNVGLFGYTHNLSQIKNLGLLNANIDGYNAVGSLVGYNFGLILNSYAISNVNGYGDYSSNGVGGLVGRNTGSIENAYSSGNVTSQYRDIGGLVGGNTGTIKNAYSTGNVTGHILGGDGTYIGGLVGWHTGGSIINSYATGKVIGNAGDAIGGLVGGGGYTVSNSFWNTETSGQTTSAGGTGLTTAQMQDLSTFTTAGWDIDAVGGTGKIWRIYDGQTAPLLRSFLTSLIITNDDTTTTYNGKKQGGGYQVVPTGTVYALSLILSQQKNATTSAVTIDLNKDLYSVQQGYDLIVQAGSGTGTLKIDPATLLITANDASKAYGETKTFNGTEFSASGLQNGEMVGQVSLNSTGSAATAGVNGGAAYAITASNATGGTFDANNYTISYSNGNLIVSPRALTITANDAGKTYGETKTFNGTEFSASGLQNGEMVGQVSLNSTGSAATAGVNGGTAYAITASNATGGTFDANNYTISYSNGKLIVAKKDITVTANSLATTYNGQNQTVSGFTASGLVNGEDESVLEDVSASVGARNAGTYINKATGTDDNYELIFVDGSLDIAKAQIDQVTGITANNKVYDGTTVASLNTGAAGFTGMVAGDDLTVANSTANFGDKNVGVGKTVNITGLRLGGADAQNYTLVNTTALTTADIQPMISASYLQAIQLRRPRYLPETNNALNTVNIELRQGGVNTSGIQTLAGEH